MEDLLNEFTSKIRNCENEGKKIYFSIAWNLKQIHDKRLYRKEYKNFTLYTEKELNFKKSFTYMLLKIANDYMENGESIFGNKFTISQVQELLYIPKDEALKLVVNNTVKENMSAREIRGIVLKKKMKLTC